MASLEKLIEKKLSKINTAPDAFVSVIDKQQKKVMEELLVSITELEVTGGVITVSEANINKIPNIIAQLQKAFFDKEYIDALTEFVGEFDAQAEITRDLIKAGIGKTPTSKQLYKAVLRASQENAATLFGEAVADQIYFQPLKEQLFLNISSGSSLKDAIKAVRTLTVNSAEADGLMYRYSKTYARTSFAQADATYTTTISKDMGVEWYKYAGGTIPDTREFCDTRHNKYYHVDEVESWGTLSDWTGKIKGTNSSTIFTNRGGWNCRHSLVPVSAIRVPKKDLQRNISNGNFKPTEKDKEELGL